MADRDLRSLIEELHNELQHAETLDDKGLELLQHLRADISELLGQPEGEVFQPSQSTLGRLQDAVDRLEVEHPTLTMLISQLLTRLSNAGI